MAALASQLTSAFSFLRDHPKLSCVLLLLLSPPIYRILLYFTPVLLSTALCIFALITLTPYVTATDAEVERSKLSASSQKPIKSTGTATITSVTGKSVRLAELSGHGNSSSSSSSFSASSLADSSVPRACSSPSPSLSSAAENSWLSWMKGLNDIGRTWMESKLVEQGLSLSEPANRETLLTLIEGSFAELVIAKENPAELFPVGDYGAVDGADRKVTHSKDKECNEALIVSSDDGLIESFTMQRSSVIDEVVCATVNTDGGDGVSKDVSTGEAIPTSKNASTREAISTSKHMSTREAIPTAKNVSTREAISTREAVPTSKNVSAREAILTTAIDSQVLPKPSDVRTPSKEQSSVVDETSNVCVPSKGHANSASEIQSDPQPLSHDVKARNEKPLTLYESSLLAFDTLPDAPAATIMPKTPSRIPAPSKLLEASRRIFSKEEQNKTPATRAPFQASSTGKVQLKPSLGSTQSKVESSVSGYRLPVPKNFLERSRSITSKGGSKLSSTPMEAQAGGKAGGECKVALSNKEGSNLHVRDANACVGDASVVHDVLLGDAKDPTLGADNGPKFDEDLEVEEAQALVQSELKMLEVELEEVAAKLPKFDESLPYQKTPVRPAKSNATTLTPTGASFRSNAALFSASPTFKTS